MPGLREKREVWQHGAGGTNSTNDPIAQLVRLDVAREVNAGDRSRRTFTTAKTPLAVELNYQDTRHYRQEWCHSAFFVCEGRLT